MNSPPPIDDLLAYQRAYYQVISRWEEHPWGVLGADPGNPHSYDSNHAYLQTPLSPEAMPTVLNEVASWYRERRLVPRLHFHCPPQSRELIAAAEDRGWAATVEPETWRVWRTDTAPALAPEVPDLTLALVGPEALDDILTARNADEAGGAPHLKAVGAALTASENTDCVLARIGGEPAGFLACVWRDGWGGVEGVETRERFRRRGVCAAMLSFLQRHAVERRAAGLHICALADEGPDRIYARAAFQPVARLDYVLLWKMER